MTGALIVIEVPGAEGPDVQVSGIPGFVLDDIRECADRRGRSLWTEILLRLAGTQGAVVPPDGGRGASPPVWSGARARLGHPSPPAAR